MPKALHLTDYFTGDSGITIADRMLYSNYPIHWHDFFEIEFVISGSGTITINNITKPFKENFLFFITPSDLQEVLINTQTPVHLINISFNLDWMHDIIANDFINGIIINDYPNYFIKKILQEYQKTDRYNQIYVFNLLNCILIDVLRFVNTATSPKREYSSEIYASLNYIRTHFREKITQVDVADFVGFSVNYFSSKFHDEIGTNFKQYLTNIRLNFALNLLKKTNIPIADVALLSGFNDISNFYNVFKRYHKSSPLQFRKAYVVKKECTFPELTHTSLTKADAEIIKKSFNDC